jgi:hypothetical protein
MLAGLTVYFSPIKSDLVFVGFLVICDWMTGMAKGVKGKNFNSSTAIRKFWVSIGYFIGLMIARSVEVYYGNDIPIVKAVVAIIAVSEIQSLRENITYLTGVDILKPVTNMFKKNGK